MESNATERKQQPINFHIFNCDNTYNLDGVEVLLSDLTEQLSCDILVVKHYFPLSQMSEMCSATIPELQMDFAVFVVHANESRLSINEDSAGIGFAKIYRALLKATGDKVLIVIGGDDNYKNENEKKQATLSRWAWRKISSQFDEKFMDGTTSFIFSWDKEHRPIHKEALLHFLDPEKAGQKFVTQINYDVRPFQEEGATSKTQVDYDLEVQVSQGSEEEAAEMLFHEEQTTADEQQSSSMMYYSYDELAELQTEGEGMLSNYPQGTILLETRMRYGKISYQEEDVLAWDQKWEPPLKVERDLGRIWRSTPEATLQFVAGRFGVNQQITNLTPLWWRPWIYLKDVFWNVFNAGT